MPARVAGYSYKIGRDGRKHRVYSKRRPASRAIRGRGAYLPARGSVSRSYANLNSLQGRGDYKEEAYARRKPGAFANDYGERIGRAIGDAVGGADIGASIGEGLQSFASLLGFGAYKVSKNSVMGMGQDPPSMHNSDSTLIVRHREYICDIVSSSSANTFSLQAFPVQPGLATAFPWLSAIAQQYEEYDARGVVYEFKTLTATAIASGTNTTMGGIIMSTDYNSINANFVNKQQMDNTEFTCSAPVYNSFYHPVECDARQNPLSNFYIRAGAVPSGSDQRMYDLGIFQIASFGVQGTSVVLGELWVTYEFAFRKPISTTALGSDVLSDHFKLTTVTNAAPLGTASTIAANSSIGGTINASGLTYSFNPLLQEGTYLIVYNVKGGATALTAPTTTCTNCTQETVWYADALNGLQSPVNGVSSATLALSIIVSITAANATIAFGAATLPTSVTAGDLYITQFDSSIIV